MLHLLPEHQKKIVLAEYHKRLGVAVCLFVIGVSVVGGVLLLPSYIVANSRYMKVEGKKESIEAQLKQISMVDTVDAVKDVNDKIAALTPKSSGKNTSEILDQFERLINSGITIEHYRYILNPDQTLSFEVSGSASNRDVLILFANRLNKSGYFTGAVVPLSSLRSDRNIKFSFKLGVTSEIKN